MRRAAACVRSAGFLLPFLLVAAPLAAQSPTGAIVGTVVDASGGGLPGASITATQSETGAVRKATSATTENFRIPLLPVGNYLLAAELASFAPAKVANVVVMIGGEATVKLTLELAKVLVPMEAE